MSRFLPSLVLCFVLSPAISQPGLSPVRVENGYLELTAGDVAKGMLTSGGWKYRAGDDASWAAPELDDSRWDTLDPRLLLDGLTRETFTGTGWFRLHLEVDTALRGRPLALRIHQQGACVVYLNGKEAGRRGRIGATKDDETRFDPHGSSLIVLPGDDARQLIAVRYSNHAAWDEYDRYGRDEAGFRMDFFPARQDDRREVEPSLISNTAYIFLFGFFFALSLIHFLLFFFYRKQKLNLYYGLFTEGVAGVFLLLFIAGNSPSPALNTRISFIAGSFLVPYFFFALLGMFYSFFYRPMPKRYWAGVGIMAAYVPFCLYYPSLASGAVALILFFIFFEIIRVVGISIARKRGGAWILGSGVLFFIASLTVFTLYAFWSGGTILLDGNTATGLFFLVLIVLAILSIPLSTSVYLAWDFSRVNSDLETQLDRVRQLSEKTLAQEQEKKRILESQKETLERQVAERTAEVVLQKEELQSKNKDITDSINYARRIQSAILPRMEDIRLALPQSFVIFLPKDIVSGDFYWFARRDDAVFLAACDCTGHGVPGAFMSMIGSGTLNQVVTEMRLEDPGEILGALNRSMRHALKQSGGDDETRDGMDAALCRLETSGNGMKLTYAGAGRPLWIVRRDTGLAESIGPDKVSVGGPTDEHFSFTSHNVSLGAGDCFYIFTDGYADQFGGPGGKKMLSRRLKKQLLAARSFSMPEQEKVLLQNFAEWKGGNEQVDDVLVIGVQA